MITQVLKDKTKMVAGIDQLDQFKREAVETTWQKVNGWAPHLHLPSLSSMC